MALCASSRARTSNAAIDARQHTMPAIAGRLSGGQPESLEVGPRLAGRRLGRGFRGEQSRARFYWRSAGSEDLASDNELAISEW